MSRYPLPWFDSAPGHQETPKPPSGGFFIVGFVTTVVESVESN